MFNENETLDVVINCKNLNSIWDVVETIGEKLQFPDYYGHNWNAWDDCMSDLEWLSQTKILVRLDNFTPTRYAPKHMVNKERPDDQRSELDSTRALYRALIFVCDFWSEEHFVKKQYTSQKKLCFTINGTDGTMTKIYSHEDWQGLS